MKMNTQKRNQTAAYFMAFITLGLATAALGPALPYLNTVLGGFEYIENPPSVTFRVYGKLITVHGRKIAVNALKDEAEARKIVEWLKREVNDAWENRLHISPSTKSTPRPKLIEILKLLPRTNCRECGEPTCMVFAARLAEGARSISDCTPIDGENKRTLEDYFGTFVLDD